ncbi:BufA1 family periplasmic bufferin-type metallophore [Cupriavidus sp. CP313]
MSHHVKNALVIAAALAAVGLAIEQNTHLLAGSPASFALDRERCFGVARAGRNDCGTALHACAGRARHDAASDEWLMLPAGTCARIAGGSLKSAAP